METFSDLRRFIAGNGDLSDSEISLLMETPLFLRMISPLSEQGSINISQIKTGSYFGKKVIMARKTPIEIQDVCVQLGRIIERVTDNYDIYGIVLDPDDENVYMDRWSIDNLFVLYQLICEPEAAEKKALLKMKKSIKENNLSEAWILGNILYDVFREKQAEYMYYLARILESLEQYQAAEEMYRKAIIDKPGNYWLYYRLASFLKKYGREKESINILMAAYNNYSMNLDEREPIEESITYVLEELINNPSIGLLKKKKFISLLEKENKKYSDCHERFIYDELEDAINGIG